MKITLTLACVLAANAMALNCSIDESMNVGGENRCSMDNECRGDRTCNSSGWCEGPSNCPSILYATEDDFMLLENEVSTLEGQV